MSESWLYDDNSAVVSVLSPETYVLHHIPRPDIKLCGVCYLIKKSIQSKKTAYKMFQVFRVYGGSIIKWETTNYSECDLQTTS